MQTDYKPTIFLNKDGTVNVDITVKHAANFIGALSRCAACDRELGDGVPPRGVQSGVELGTCTECTQAVRDQLFDLTDKDSDDDVLDLSTIVVDEDDGYID